ncbi:MAG: response regulator [Lysobacterales bacterium]|jgi:CheY-like chemotaxis protein
MSVERILRILVADDHDVIRVLVSAVLSQAGHSVSTVRDGSECIEALSNGEFDLVVMDCSMPVMDGLQATRTIRGSTGEHFDPCIPIIALTALGTATDRKNCLDAGMDDHLSKTDVTSELVGRVTRLVEGVHPTVRSGRQQLGESGQVVDSLRGRLLEEAASWKSRLAEFQEQGDWAAIGSLAHKIRGAADIFSDRGLSQAAAAVEEAAKPDSPWYQALADRLEVLLARLEVVAQADLRGHAPADD